MKIGIYGGSFNPVNINHLKICKNLLKNKLVDKIIMVPTGIHYEYKNNLISNQDRFNMLSLATKDNSDIMISDYELKDYVVYTIDTLKYYKELYKNDEIYFICGLDNLSYIDKWHKGMDYFKYNIIAIDRIGYSREKIILKFKDYLDKITFVKIELDKYSSTTIRNDISNNIDIKDKVDDNVLVYIKKQKLYKSNC